MGWWDVSEDPKIVTGDSVLDATRHFLQEVSREYQSGLARKPTLAELEYTLNLAFRNNLTDDVLEGFEELELKQIVLKTAKRPKRIKAKVGDIFAFRIKDKDLFGFGRLVSTVSVGMVAEIFDHFAAQPFFDHSRMNSWLFSPVIVNQYILFEAKMQGDWRIIEYTENFEPGKKFSDVVFVYGEPPNSLKAVGIDDKERPITPKEGTGRRRYSALNDTQMQALVAEVLKVRG